MTKEEATEAALDGARRNFDEGFDQEIDVDALAEALERYGWTWTGN